MGIEDAIHTALLTLKEGFEGQVSGSNIEVRARAQPFVLVYAGGRADVCLCTGEAMAAQRSSRNAACNPSPT